jgi:hydroxyacylglutathione hydrolase
VRLLPGVHLVGSGSGGFDLSDPYDCHVYLVDGGTAAALVDAGIGRATDELLARVEDAGVEPERVGLVLLTHAHPDHAAGAAALRERLPRAQVAASPSVARWVREGDEDAMSLAAGKRADFYPQDLEVSPCAVECELGDGDEVAVGNLSIRALDTPGHAEGHMSYLLPTPAGPILFAGDLVFFGGRISLEHTWDCSIQAYARSMARLAGAGITALLPGHHAVSLRNGQRHVDAANRLWERGFVPRSVV